MKERRYKQLSKEIFNEVIPLPSQALTVGQTKDLVNAYADAMQCIHRRADEREAQLRQRLCELGVSFGELVAWSQSENQTNGGN